MLYFSLVLLLKYCYQNLFLVHSVPVSSYFAAERTDDMVMLAACICLLIINIVEPSYIGVPVLFSHK